MRCVDMVHDRGLPPGIDTTRCPECRSPLVSAGLVEEPFDTYECENCGYKLILYPAGSKAGKKGEGPDVPFP